MSRKIRVGILFGGKSAEHEVSLQSAKNIVDAIDKEKHEILLIGIDRQGQWYINDDSIFLLEAEHALHKLNKTNTTLGLIPGATSSQLVVLSGTSSPASVDIMFPILHGPYGEDRTVQGFLKLANIAHVGAGVLASSVGMDKDVMKRLLRDAGIPVARFLTLHRTRQTMSFNDIHHELGLPFFVKPANLGSSVGIHKVGNQEGFQAALADAFQYDHKVLVEEYIQGREIECAVLGNDNPIASVPGEIIPQHEFYSYEAKYIDENGAVLEIPAPLSPQTTERIQQLAIEVFRILCCEGMARVDFFLRGEDEVIVNEINTIPGFTKISMYPKLWEASGLSYTNLISKLIELGLEKFEADKQLKTSR